MQKMDHVSNQVKLMIGSDKEYEYRKILCNEQRQLDLQFLLWYWLCVLIESSKDVLAALEVISLCLGDRVGACNLIDTLLLSLQEGISLLQYLLHDLGVIRCQAKYKRKSVSNIVTKVRDFFMRGDQIYLPLDFLASDCACSKIVCLADLSEVAMNLMASTSNSGTRPAASSRPPPTTR